MSHKTNVETAFLDREQVAKTCEQLGYEFLDVKEINLYEGKQACAYAIQIPGWRYPIAITEEGKSVFDNFEGQWGKEEKFDKFRQGYAENVTLAHADRSGYRVLHRELTQDGTLQIRLGR
jgi:hypothetical protein